MEALTPEDFTRYPVWESALDLETIDEFAMRPVRRLPVNDLTLCMVGMKVRLANGSHIWAGIANIFPKDPVETKRCLIARFYIDGRWFPLSRDMNLEMYGPAALARKLGLGLDDVFPISYDVSGHCVGDANAVRGLIEVTPSV